MTDKYWTQIPFDIMLNAIVSEQRYLMSSKINISIIIHRLGYPVLIYPACPPYSGHCWSPMVYHNGTFCLNFSRYSLLKISWAPFKSRNHEYCTFKKSCQFFRCESDNMFLLDIQYFYILCNESILKNSYLWNKLYKNILICKKRI